MPWSYVTVERLQDTLKMEASRRVVTDDDATVDALLKLAVGVSASIDRHCSRTFRVYQATQRFTPEFEDLLYIPDLITLTSLKTDYDLDNTPELVWTTADYYLEPSNAPVMGRPYTRVKVRPNVLGFTQYFNTEWPEYVEIVGKWGYSEDLQDSGISLGADCTDAETTLTVDKPGDIRRGSTYLVGSEQLFVTQRDLTANTIRVRRAQNGTTAAAHSNGDALSVYSPPEAVEVAALMQAVRAYRRTEAPLGVVNTPGDIGWRAIYIPKFDADVAQLLRDYRKQAMF